MDVKLEKKNNLHAQLKINISKEDYAPRVEAELKKYQKKVAVPGFRPGHAPIGMVKKMYGKSIYVDEVNRLASESMFSYLKENKIEYLAQPLLSESEENKINFEDEDDFLFTFELGLAPEIDMNISSADELVYYKIEVNDQDIDKEIENITRRYAEQQDVDTSEEKDIVYMNATELDESGNPFEGGIEGKEISTTPELIKNEELKRKLTGVKIGDEITADIFDLFNDNETVISTSLGMPKEGISDLNRNFKLEVTSIKRFINSELNQQLFDKVFGEGEVKSEEEFRERLKGSLENYYKGESDHMFEHELDHLIQDKHNFDLPEEFLKKWLMENNPDTFTPENIDEKFNTEAKGLRYTLLRNKVLADNNVEISKEDVDNMSMAYSADMIRRYGIPNPDEALVRRVAEGNLKEEGYMSRMSDMVAQRKFIELVRTMVTPLEKRVSVEEFYEILNKHNHEHNH